MSRLTRSLLVLAFVALSFSACKKTENPAPTPTPPPYGTKAVCYVPTAQGTPPVCHDANGEQTTCPSDPTTLPVCK